MEKVTLELIYARHAESFGNVSAEQGRGSALDADDPALTPLGVRQAELLGERLAAGELSAVFASPLTRAIHTAHEVALRQAKKPPVELLPDLMEVGTRPGFTGYPVDAIKSKFPLAMPCLQEPTPTGGALSLGAEEYADSAARAKRCIDYFRARFSNGERVLFVSHGTFASILLRCALNAGGEASFRWSAFNTGITKIKFYEGGMVKLSYSNDTSHLYPLMNDLAFRI